MRPEEFGSGVLGQRVPAPAVPEQLNEELMVVYRDRASGSAWKVKAAGLDEAGARQASAELLRHDPTRTVRVVTPVIEFTSAVLMNERRF